MICFRLLESDDPATPLAEAVATLRRGEDAESVYAVNPKSFRQVPNAPFAYWVSERIRGLFTELPPFESEGRTARVGDHPGDGFRYIRLWFEVPRTPTQVRWPSYQKGGQYSPFYCDIHLCADWDYEKQSYRGFLGRPGRSSKRPSNYEFFFRPGLTWPRRTQSGLALRTMAANCVFADKGPVAFVDGNNANELLSTLALTLSLGFRGLVEIQMAFGSYEVGVIQRTVVPDLNNEAQDNLAPLAKSAWSLKRHLDTTNSNSHAFYAPALTPGQCTAPRLSAKPGGTR